MHETRTTETLDWTLVNFWSAGRLLTESAGLLTGDVIQYNSLFCLFVYLRVRVQSDSDLANHMSLVYQNNTILFRPIRTSGTNSMTLDSQTITANRVR